VLARFARAWEQGGSPALRVASGGAVKLLPSIAVAKARKAGRPLVALESSVLAQGLPWPHNLEAWRRCEAAVREEGAEPATIAVLEGRLHLGLSVAQATVLARGAQPLLKLGARDLAVAVAQGRSGGTTVSATLELAAAAGIAVFATGGLGGVHRGVEEHLDISQDLPALARWPVGVVCAGAKSVLDLPRTLEQLETLGVPVIGVGTYELPGFYTRETGLPLEHRVDTPAQAAAVLRARLVTLGQGGLVFALPPPHATALKRSFVDTHLEAALALARKQGVSGKAVTPFLLSQLAQRTQGKSLLANLALLAHNATFAAQVAVAYARGRR
jgi:pseudouridine-5'-phosphate glycosidase